MQKEIPIELFFSVLAICGTLIGIIYKNLNDKIKELEKQICSVPTIQLQADIATIKNDISWIKNKFFNGIK